MHEPSPHPVSPSNQNRSCQRTPPRRPSRDLVSLYAARAEAQAIDLRPVIDAYRDPRPTSISTTMDSRYRPVARPRAVGRGTALHRQAIRENRVVGRTRQRGAGWAAPGRGAVSPPWLPLVALTMSKRGLRRRVIAAGFAVFVVLVGAAGRGLA